MGEQKKGCPKDVRGQVIFPGLGDSTHATVKKKKQHKMKIGRWAPVGKQNCPIIPAYFEISF
jgi:hypothetical protein